MKLSILICSIKGREHLLKRLTDVLDKQVDGLNSQYLVRVDDRKITTGMKRNHLMEAAKGEYVCFIDDDDMVPDYYVAEILEAIKTSPDVVGFNGYMTTNGQNRKPFIISNRFDRWYEDARYYYRTPNHLSPIKRDIAISVGFPNVNFGEDASYSQGIKKLINTEVFIDKDMYHYDWWVKTSTQTSR